MFNLDFKPQFYSYPLSKEEYAKIKLRNRDLLDKINKLENQLQEISRIQSYQVYRSRIIDRIQIMREEMKEYGQVLQCHQNIDAELKANRKNSVQIKNKLLESYKVESLAKQYRKVTQKSKERQMQRQMLRNGENLMLQERIRSKEKKLFLNKSQIKYSLGQKHLPNFNNKIVNSLKKYQLNLNNNPQNSRTFLQKVKLPRINMTNIRRSVIAQDREENNRSQRWILIQK